MEEGRLGAARLLLIGQSIFNTCDTCLVFINRPLILDTPVKLCKLCKRSKRSKRDK